MKLYIFTEEQLIQFIGEISNNYDYNDIKNIIEEELTPIELPSDDEIARVGLEFSVGYNVEYWNGFKHCGEWMKEQILNQNK